MAVRVKVDTKAIKKLGQKFVKQAQRKLPSVLKKSIIDESIKVGVSPVENRGRFKQYSKSYKDVIRGKVRFIRRKGRSQPIPLKQKDPRVTGLKTRVAPVNMTLTGEMLKSFFVKVTVKGLKLGFKSPIADFHQEGIPSNSGKVVRRLLPTGANERFNRSISIDIANAIDRILREVLSRRR